MAWKRRSRPCFAVPPAESPSTMNSSQSLGSSHAQSASYSKVLNVPVPGLKPNYTLEAIVTRRDLSRARMFRYTQEPLATSLPTGQCALVDVRIRPDD